MSRRPGLFALGQRYPLKEDFGGYTLLALRRASQRYQIGTVMGEIAGQPYVIISFLFLVFKSVISSLIFVSISAGV